MKKRTQLIFWTATFLMLVVLFSGSLDSWLLSFYFVSFLLPVIMASSLYFSEILVPRFLMTDRYRSFAIRFFYLLVISIYAELLVMMTAFVILADYSIGNLGTYAGDIRLLALIMYLVVFGYSFLNAFMRFKKREGELKKLTEVNEEEVNPTMVLVINRKKVPVTIAEIRMIESLSDYIKVHLADATLIARERISKMEEELPREFVRIHRSFLINKNFVESFTNEHVTIQEQHLTLGRKFKNEALKKLAE